MKSSLLLLALALGGCGAEDSAALQVYAASSLVEVLEEIRLNQEPPPRLRTESSGHLAREILAGAPADIFLSAHPEWLDRLEEEGKVVPGSRRIVAGNRLALALAPGAPSVAGPNDLPRLDSIALGEWTSVPAGRYAKQALEKAGVWKDMQSRCVFTHNARAALTLVEQGRVQGAFVYASDLAPARNARLGWAVPDTLHDPIWIEGCVLRRTASPERGAALLRAIADSPLWFTWGFLAAS